MYTQSYHLAGKLLAVDGGGGTVVHTVFSPRRLWMVVVGLLYTQSSHLAGKLLAGDAGGGVVVHTVLSPGRRTPGW